MVKISVIMPVFNGAKTIVSSLNSLQLQTYDDFEVIIVNDGSTDNTLDVVHSTLKYSKFEWKIINVPHRGPGAARNIGIKKARGNLIYFLDSDDKIKPNALEAMSSKFKEHNIDIVVCGFTISTSNGKIIKQFHPKSAAILDGYSALVKYLKGELKIVMGSIMIKRSLIKNKNIYFPPTYHGEDILFVSNTLYNSNKVYVLRDILFEYISNIQSLSSYKNTSLRTYTEYIKTLKSISTSINNREITNIVLQEKIPKATLSSSIQVLKKKDINLVVNFFKYPHVIGSLRLIKFKPSNFEEWILSRIILSLYKIMNNKKHIGN